MAVCCIMYRLIQCQYICCYFLFTAGTCGKTASEVSATNKKQMAIVLESSPYQVTLNLLFYFVFLLVCVEGQPQMSWQLIMLISPVNLSYSCSSATPPATSLAAPSCHVCLPRFWFVPCPLELSYVPCI